MGKVKKKKSPCQFPQFSLTSKQETPGSPGAYQKQKYKSTMFKNKYKKLTQIFKTHSIELPSIKTPHKNYLLFKNLKRESQ